MVLLVTIAFFMAVAGCFIMLELSPFAFLDGLTGYPVSYTHLTLPTKLEV